MGVTRESSPIAAMTGRCVPPNGFSAKESWLLLEVTVPGREPLPKRNGRMCWPLLSSSGARVALGCRSKRRIDPPLAQNRNEY